MKRGCVVILTKTTAAQNEAALGYYRVRGLYGLEVIFVATISIKLIGRDNQSTIQSYMTRLKTAQVYSKCARRHDVAIFRV